METKQLTLVVKEKTLGALVTNAQEIKNFVAERIKDYTPDKFIDKADKAKKALTELNKAKKTLNDERLALEREFMAPFVVFKGLVRETTDLIDEASAKLNAIVKAEEERERALKYENLKIFFDGLSFTLVPLEQFFDQRWLNKTTKLGDAKDAIKAKVDKILADIKTLDSLDDAEELKALYLEDLDLGSAIRAGEEMKQRRERLASEAAQRAEREQAEEQRRQTDSLIEDVQLARESAELSSLVADALEAPVDPDPFMSYTLRISARRSVLLDLRAWLIDRGSTFKKLEG